MGMPWKQTKLYTCFRCRQSYLHDRMHRHAQHECPERPQARLQRALEGGKTYRPAIERER